MKSKIFFLTLLFLLAITCTTCSTKNLKTVDSIDLDGSVIPVNGRVPDEETAIRIAEAVWLPIYGSKPFKARLVNESIWVVNGTLPKGYVGGTPYAEISKSDGNILKVSHGR